MRAMGALCVALWLSSCGTPPDEGVDAAGAGDGGLDAATTLDADALDAGSDAGSGPDAGSGSDSGSGPDAGSDSGSDSDAGSGSDSDSGPDSDSDAGSGSDAGSDAGADSGSLLDAGPPPIPGLDTPCAHGPGWALLAFHIDGSTSPRIDVWDASCSYSLAPSSQCNVVPVRSVALVMDGTAATVSSSDYYRARFSVEGLSFTSATLYVQGRSYSTGSSTNVRIWSPLHGERIAGPIDNDWTYDWYAVDWSDRLFPDDEPALTAFQIYASGGSGSLAVRAVELCLE